MSIDVTLHSVMCKLREGNGVDGKVIDQFDWMPGVQRRQMHVMISEYDSGAGARSVLLLTECDDLDVRVKIEYDMFQVVDPKIERFVTIYKTENDDVLYEDFHLEVVISYSHIEHLKNLDE